MENIMKGFSLEELLKRGFEVDISYHPPLLIAEKRVGRKTTRIICQEWLPFSTTRTETEDMRKLSGIEQKHLFNLGKKIYGDDWDPQFIDSSLNYWENKSEILRMSCGLFQHY